MPPEGVFDTGLGELFVVRVAGNIATPSQIGSIEFAAQEFDTPLVVVLGHSRCGAVTSTVEVARGSGERMSPSLMAIVDRIRPAVEEVLAAHEADDLETVVAHSVRANVRAVASSLCEDSELIASRVRDDALLVVGAEYALETGAVEFGL